MFLDATTKMSERIKVNDPREQSKVKYPLVPTLFAMIIAWIAGCTSAVKIERFWEEHFDKLKLWIPNFPDHYISHDTVNRLLSLIAVNDLKGLMSDFCQLVLDNAVSGEMDNVKRVLSLDGQTPRALEYEAKPDKHGNKISDRRSINNRLYYVTLYDSTSGLSLAMERVQDKENENQACVRAVQMFDLTGTIVTADALNTQRSVAEAIINRGGDYVLALKNNHKAIVEAVVNAISSPLLLDTYGSAYRTDVEIDHGRIERRTVIALPVSVIPNRKILKAWNKDCKTVFYAVTESAYQKYDVKREPEQRLFLSSLSNDHPDIAKLGYRAIRDHWKIENQLHWVLDMDFGQDHMQIKNRNYIDNAELLSRLALNVIKMLQPSMKVRKRQELPSISSIIDKIKCNPGKHILKIANALAYGKL